MFLKSLNLQNFRIFKKKTLQFKQQATVLLGQNAIGKTCVLEAIYLLSTGKSFRASKEEEMISYGEEMTFVDGDIVILDSLRSTGSKFFSSNRSRKQPKDSVGAGTIAVNVKKENSEQSPREFLKILLTRGEVQGKRTARKLYKVNGVGKRWRDFAGQLKVVLFRPEDIDLVLGSPSLRRDFLDEILEQTNWQYRGCNLAYKKGLRQRNKLLDRIREGQGNKSQLVFWNQLLCKNGQLVTQKREELIEFFNQQLKDWQVFYDRSTISEARLEQYAAAELAIGNTLVGPHRDDIKFKVNPSSTKSRRGRENEKLKVDRDLALYGSRGEQRMAILQLKLAQLEFVKQKTQQKPVLLLDDIFSELDKSHRQKVLQIIDSCQTIITTTEPKFIPSLDSHQIERL